MIGNKLRRHSLQPVSTASQAIPLSAPIDSSAYQHLPGAAEMNDVDQGLADMRMGLREQQFNRDARRYDKEFEMAKQNQEARALASRTTGTGPGLSPGLVGTLWKGVNSHPDEWNGSFLPPTGMASIPPEHMTAFNRGQMRQPAGGVYNPGYGQVQGSAPAPGVRPGGYGLYGQGSYQNMGSPAANDPVNGYGLRRTPTAPGADRRPGDANLDITNVDPEGVKTNGGQVLGTYGQGAKLIRGADGRNRVVENPSEKEKAYYAGLRKKRIETGTAKRQAFLTDRANTIEERRNQRLGIKMPKGLLGPSPLIGNGKSTAMARPKPTPAEKSALQSPEAQPVLKQSIGIAPAIDTPADVYDAINNFDAESAGPEATDRFRKGVEVALQRDEFKGEDPHANEVRQWAEDPTYEMEAVKPKPRSLYDDVSGVWRNVVNGAQGINDYVFGQYNPGGYGRRLQPPSRFTPNTGRRL